MLHLENGTFTRGTLTSEPREGDRIRVGEEELVVWRVERWHNALLQVSVERDRNELRAAAAKRAAARAALENPHFHYLVRTNGGETWRRTFEELLEVGGTLTEAHGSYRVVRVEQSSSGATGHAWLELTSE
jgi:hypothetical protein